MMMESESLRKVAGFVILLAFFVVSVVLRAGSKMSSIGREIAGMVQCPADAECGYDRCPMAVLFQSGSVVGDGYMFGPDCHITICNFRPVDPSRPHRFKLCIRAWEDDRYIVDDCYDLTDTDKLGSRIFITTSPDTKTYECREILDPVKLEDVKEKKDITVEIAGVIRYREGGETHVFSTVWHVSHIPEGEVV